LKNSKFFSKYTDIVHTIYLHRNNLRDMYDDYKQQLDAIEQGRSVIIFPEGTIYE
jgi:1-acyl-sn-glycerol-3-phosphate acyltransferase